MTPSNRKILAKIKAKLAEPPRTGGNWVLGISGKIVWDPWDFPEPSADEAAQTLEHLVATMNEIADRMRAAPGWKEPTPRETTEIISGMEEFRERYDAEKAAVRAFTAKVWAEKDAAAV